MPRRQFNDGMEIIENDFNKISAASEKELLDRVAFHLGQEQENFCFGSGLLVTRTDADTISVAAGVGVQTDSSQVDPEPKKRLMVLEGAVSKDLTAAHATLGRIDLVCIKAARAVVESESRNFKDVDTGDVTSTSFDVENDWEADVLIVDGTPSGSPAAPSTPAGYIKIAELAITAVSGLGSNGVTDTRTVFLPPSSRVDFVEKSADYTGLPTDEIVYMNASGGNRTYTLPPLASCPKKKIGVMKTDSSGNYVDVDPSGTETANGSATAQRILYQYTILWFHNMVTEWRMI